MVFIDKDGKQFTLLLVINQRVLFDQMVKVAFVRSYDCLLSVSVKHNSLALFQTLNRCLKSQWANGTKNWTQQHHIDWEKKKKISYKRERKNNCIWKKKPNNDWLFRAGCVFNSSASSVYHLIENEKSRTRELEREKNKIPFNFKAKKLWKYHHWLYYFLG